MTVPVLIIPVSYTHLDVYKRQGKYIAHFHACGIGRFRCQKGNHDAGKCGKQRDPYTVENGLLIQTGRKDLDEMIERKAPASLFRKAFDNDIDLSLIHI